VGLARALVPVLVVLVTGSCGRGGNPRNFVLATTTSVQDSGLLTHLRDAFKKETGIEIHPVAVGSGKALRLAADGQAEATITHDPEAERAFVAAGQARFSRPFMWNDFVLVGLASDPAAVRASRSAVDAFHRIDRAQAPFASRSDQSGTHRREMQLWASSGIDPNRNPSYRKLGQPMGALLRSAGDLGAYALTDRATFENLAPAIHLEVLFEGDPALRNVYTISLVRRTALEPEDRNAQAFADWLLSPRGQQAIESFRVRGKQQFFVR